MKSLSFIMTERQSYVSRIQFSEINIYIKIHRVPQKVHTPVYFNASVVAIIWKTTINSVTTPDTFNV